VFWDEVWHSVARRYNHHFLVPPVVFLGTANLLNLDIVGLILSVEPAGAAARTRSGELQAKSRANRHQLAYKYYVWQWGRCPVKWQY